MDYSQFIFALAVIIIGVVRWFIENRSNAGNEEQRDSTDSDLPEWQWPTEEQQQAPPALPTLRSAAPNSPTIRCNKTPAAFRSGIAFRSATQNHRGQKARTTSRGPADKIRLEITC